MTLTSTVPFFMANDCARADSNSSSAFCCILCGVSLPLRKPSAPKRRDSMAFSLCSTQWGMLGCQRWAAHNHTSALAHQTGERSGLKREPVRSECYVLPQPTTF